MSKTQELIEQGLREAGLSPHYARDAAARIVARGDDLDLAEAREEYITQLRTEITRLRDEINLTEVKQAMADLERGIIGRFIRRWAGDPKSDTYFTVISLSLVVFLTLFGITLVLVS